MTMATATIQHTVMVVCRIKYTIAHSVTSLNFRSLNYCAQSPRYSIITEWYRGLHFPALRLPNDSDKHADTSIGTIIVPLRVLGRPFAPKIPRNARHNWNSENYLKARETTTEIKSELVDSIFNWHGNVKLKQTAFEVEINDYRPPYVWSCFYLLRSGGWRLIRTAPIGPAPVLLVAARRRPTWISRNWLCLLSRLG